MKVILMVILSLLVFAKECSSQGSLETEREQDIKAIIDVYEKNANTYLSKFGRLQVKPLQKGASEAEISLYNTEVQTSFEVHRDNFTMFGRKTFKALMEKPITSYTQNDKRKLLEAMEIYYKTEFIFLDHDFFSNSKIEIEKIFNTRKPG